MPPDPALTALLDAHGQGHLLRGADALGPEALERHLGELRRIDYPLVDRLVAALVHAQPEAGYDPAEVRPVEVARLPRTDAERVARRHAADAGARMLAAGEVAVVLVAGGQGTRLGFDGPKGTYPIAPVSAASLFQIHAEKVVALGRKHGRPIPFYVMTSPENHAATAEFFAAHRNFGLSHLRLFEQGRMPAVDRSTGKILLAEPGRVALSPDGHGGTLTALARDDDGPSCLDEMRERGVKTLFYFQVDNPLVQIADPAFLGLHRAAEAEVSFKVVEKVLPEEKVGVVVEVAGKPQVIEYSDLSPELAGRAAPAGGLELWAGSIAIHVFDRAFVERLVTGGATLPYHRAVKKVPFLDDDGRKVSPAEPNAVKFETFIFDALPMANRYAIVETDRAVEFEPLKNATGADSPATVRARMSDLFAGWLENAGATVARGPDGAVPFGIEISPLYAVDAEELRAKVPMGLVVDRAFALGPVA